MWQSFLLIYELSLKLFLIAAILYIGNLCIGIFLKQWKKIWWNRMSISLLAIMAILRLYQNLVLFKMLKVETSPMPRNLSILLFLWAMVLQYAGYKRIKEEGKKKT